LRRRCGTCFYHHVLGENGSGRAGFGDAHETAGQGSGIPYEAAHETFQAVDARLVFKAGDGCEPGYTEDLRSRGSREGKFVGKVAVADRHAVEAFRVGDVRDAAASGPEYAANGGEHTHQVRTSEMFKDVQGKDDVNRACRLSVEEVFQGSASSRCYSQADGDVDLLLGDVDSSDVAVADLVEDEEHGSGTAGDVENPQVAVRRDMVRDDVSEVGQARAEEFRRFPTGPRASLAARDIRLVECGLPACLFAHLLVFPSALLVRFYSRYSVALFARA